MRLSTHYPTQAWLFNYQFQRALRPAFVSVGTSLADGLRPVNPLIQFDSYGQFVVYDTIGCCHGCCGYEG